MVRSVTFRCINQINTKFFGTVKNIIDFFLGIVFTPVPAKLPGAHTYDGYIQLGLAQSSVFHATHLED
ncbi:hypothetical protein D3C76_1661080 [compost metagenome]